MSCLPKISILNLDFSVKTNFSICSSYRVHSQLCLANPGQAVIDKLHASNFAHLIGENKIFLSVADAVLSYAQKMEEF